MMRKSRINRRRFLALGMALVLLTGMGGGALSVSAATKSELEQKLESLEKKAKEIENNLANTSKELSASQQRKNLLDSQIGNMKEQIDLLNEKLSNLNNKIAAKETAIKQASADITAKETAIEATHTALGQRLKAIAKSGNMSALQRLLNTENYTDYLLKAKAAECIADHDQAIMDELAAALEEIRQQKSKLEQEKKDIQSQQAEVKSLKSTSDKKKSKLDTLYAAAQSEVKKLSSSESYYEQQLAATKREIEKTDAAITALINSTGSTGNYNSRWMYWPVPTVRAVSSFYGDRWGTRHKGLDIANGPVRIYGQNIVAAADGTVIYANYTNSWGGGYGYYCIVDHGRNSKGQIVSTLYAHCSKMFARVGQKVTGGKTVLAQAGATGDITGPHLHFEVRLNGVQVDPWNYVRPNIN